MKKKKHVRKATLGPWLTDFLEGYRYGYRQAVKDIKQLRKPRGKK